MTDYERKWRTRWNAIVKYGSYGALFAGGALLVAELVGPRVARDLGGASGESFAYGVNRARRWIGGT